MIASRLSPVLFIFIATLALGQQSQSPSGSSAETGNGEPSLPVIDYNACPFEGCSFRKWKVLRESTMYSTWEEKRVEISRLKPGQEVTGITGVHITSRPDRILVKKEIPNLGLNPGDIIFRYMYVGEGFANIWTKGTWHKEADCSFLKEKNGDGCTRDCAAIVTEEGVKNWWVNIKTSDGKMGWVLAEDNFGGMDALGPNRE